MKLREILTGNKTFYKTVLGVAVPIMVQNGVSQFVNVLDNLMVGAMGTEQMSGVAIANRLIFVFNLCVFGGISGAGIFTAQFYGRGDTEGVKNTFRFKLWVAAFLTAAAAALFGLMPEKLVSLFLHDTGSGGDVAATLSCGLRYLAVMELGYLPYALSFCYSSTMRESRQTLLPMAASLGAVVLNLFGNWVLIWGRFGLPALGVTGAALATVISRYFELAVLLIAGHGSPGRYPYFSRVYATLRVPRSLIGPIVKKGLPLLLNEALWAGGQTTLNQLYSYRGLVAVAATNISSTVGDLFTVVFCALGASIGIVVGNLLGADRFEEARKTDARMIAFSCECCMLISILLFASSRFFPSLYNTSAEVRETAAMLLRLTAGVMPLWAISHACYFTLRSGGLTGFTMALDSGYTWLVSVPAAFIVCRLTALPLISCYAIVAYLEIVKVVTGITFVRRGKWIRNIVSDPAELS